MNADNIKDNNRLPRGAQPLTASPHCSHFDASDELSFLKAMLDAVPAPIFAKSTDGKLLHCNRAFADFVGRDRADIAGSPMEAVIGAEQAAIHRVYDQEVVAGGREDGYEVRIRDRNGAMRDVIVHKAVIGKGDGSLDALAGVLFDITDMRAAKSEMRAARLEAEQANKAKSEFLGAVSHELRTPLNAILGFAEVIREELFGALNNPRYESYIGDIHRSAQLLLGLIDGLLDISAIEVKSLQLNRSLLDLTELGRRSVMLVRRHAETKNIALVENFTGGPLPYVGDKLRLQQVLLNLLTNAIRYSGEKGQVTVFGGRDGDAIVLAIADTGCGMSADDLAIALKPFGRVARPGHEDIEGSGLGLPLTKGLVEAHGGTLTIESKVGEGTVVTIRLPGDFRP